MVRGLRVAVVIPALDPDWRLEAVVRGLPGWVDLAIVVDDGSRAAVRPVAGALVVRHGRNLGVGAAILRGYREARDLGCDVAVVMAADGQMDPADLPAVLAPVASGDADYVKGDRLSHPACRAAMPAVRRFGNCCLTFLTRIACGRWALTDSQCGFTALRLAALDRLPLDWLYPRYGFPNDLLAAVTGAGLRLAEVPVRPVYSGEPSGIRVPVAVAVYPLVLLRSVWVRAAAAWRARTRPVSAAAEATRCAS